MTKTTGSSASGITECEACFIHDGYFIRVFQLSMFIPSNDSFVNKSAIARKVFYYCYGIPMRVLWEKEAMPVRDCRKLNGNICEVLLNLHFQHSSDDQHTTLRVSANKIAPGRNGVRFVGFISLFLLHVQVTGVFHRALSRFVLHPTSHRGYPCTCGPLSEDQRATKAIVQWDEITPYPLCLLILNLVR